MNFGHSEPANSLLLKVELNQHCGLVPHGPTVMTGFDNDRLRSSKFQCAAVCVFNVNPSLCQKPDVRVHAEFRPNGRFHILGPAKSGWIDDTPHATVAGSNHIDFDAAELATLATRDRCKEWIVDAHEFLRGDSSIALEFYQSQA
jgi:hypothetical protein